MAFRFLVAACALSLAAAAGEDGTIMRRARPAHPAHPSPSGKDGKVQVSMDHHTHLAKAHHDSHPAHAHGQQAASQSPPGNTAATGGGVGAFSSTSEASLLKGHVHHKNHAPAGHVQHKHHASNKAANGHTQHKHHDSNTAATKAFIQGQADHAPAKGHVQHKHHASNKAADGHSQHKHHDSNTAATKAFIEGQADHAPAKGHVQHKHHASNKATSGHTQHTHHEALIQEEAGEMDPSNPCSFLGCNSHKCAWASGGAITRLVAKKACKNSLSVGSGSATADAVTSLTTISTLKDCMHAVMGKSSQCSGSFQMHKGTSECSCVPAGAECTEAEDENICRFQILEQ